MRAKLTDTQEVAEGPSQKVATKSKLPLPPKKETTELLSTSPLGRENRGAGNGERA